MADIDRYKQQLQEINNPTVEQYTLVKRIAYHLSSRLPKNIVFEDLVQAGMEGLLQAKRGFDASKGVDFEYFAKSRVRGAMLDEVRRISFSTRNAVATKRKQNEVIRALTNELGRQPKNHEIASRLNLSMEEHEKTRLLASSADVISADEAPEAFEITDAETLTPDSQVEKEEQLQGLTEAVGKLPERNQQILALYYQEEMNLKEIGEILSVSESRVSQILTETALKLRTLMT